MPLVDFVVSLLFFVLPRKLLFTTVYHCTYLLLEELIFTGRTTYFVINHRHVRVFQRISLFARLFHSQFREISFRGRRERERERNWKKNLSPRYMQRLSGRLKGKVKGIANSAEIAFHRENTQRGHSQSEMGKSRWRKGEERERESRQAGRQSGRQAEGSFSTIYLGANAFHRVTEPINIKAAGQSATFRT